MILNYKKVCFFTYFYFFSSVFYIFLLQIKTYMTNVSRIKHKKNMYLHIQKSSFEIIDKYLQKNYVQDAIDRCQFLKIETTEKNLMQIKNKRGSQNINYLKILQVLVDMALENKKLILELENKIINN